MEPAIDEASESRLQQIRETEYPSLKDVVYLDHAGTSPIAKSLVDRFSADLISNLYGNPHSNSTSSQLATRRIENVRLDTLRFFNADPAEFDIVFVANATAGIKLVVDACRDLSSGFWYGYHVDSHTSLVGGRESAACGSRCFASDQEVDDWMQSLTCHASNDTIDCAAENVLFAYPAQSNLNGRRLPQRWSGSLRDASRNGKRNYYSLLDAAAFVTTSPLDLSDPDKAPDFTVCSFYKIFGFPDLGGLIVRKDAAHIFRSRKYFGGGTVDMVVAIKERWHSRRDRSIHESLEDGTLPTHSIIALGLAMEVHHNLFGSQAQVSRRTSSLSQLLYRSLASLQHATGNPLCILHKAPDSRFGDPETQGPIIAFNMQNSRGAWIPNSEVEKLASIKGIHLRAGGLCNPGGIASFLNLEPWEMKRNFSAGHRCGNDMDIVSGKPTGMLRVSLGATTTLKEIQEFSSFLREFFVDEDVGPIVPDMASHPRPLNPGNFYVEAMIVYPIKSCGGWRVPPGKPWEIRQEGLVWDREWCIVHQGTGAALSQKGHPKMALLRPTLDLEAGTLRVEFKSLGSMPGDVPREVVVPLSADPNYFGDLVQADSSLVCGEKVQARAYKSADVAKFFSHVLEVPCTLARLAVNGCQTNMRQAKAHIQQHQLDGEQISSGSHEHRQMSRPIRLSNESPILAISRSSLNRLNEQIKRRGGRAVEAEAFRPNVIIAQEFGRRCGMEQPYVEDYWRVLMIGNQHFEILGSCRRCQMVCIDQQTGERHQEPFVTLSKTRRFDGKVWFGQHMCHLPSITTAATAASQHPTMTIGDMVTPSFHGEHSQSVLRQSGVVP